MNRLIEYTNTLFESDALYPLRDYRIVAHQDMTVANYEMLENLIANGINPSRIFVLPVADTYIQNRDNGKLISKNGMNLIWDGWINKTTKLNAKHDDWSNCMDSGQYINADCNNAIHLYRSLLNGKFQNTIVLDSKNHLIADVDNHIRVTEYNKNCIFGIYNGKKTLEDVTHFPIMDVGISRYKFAIGDMPHENILTSALTLAAIYSIFQKEYERETLSRLAEKNPSIIVPERPSRFRAQQLDLNIEDKIVKEYRKYPG